MPGNSILGSYFLSRPISHHNHQLCQVWAKSVIWALSPPAWFCYGHNLNNHNHNHNHDYVTRKSWRQKRDHQHGLQCFPSRIWALSWIRGNSVMLLNYARLASGRYPLLMFLWRNLYGWSLYDLQTRRYYYSTPQRAKRSRSWISEYGVQRCRDRASPPGHLRRSIKQRISLKIWMWGYIYARGFWERHRSAFFDARVCHPNAVSYKSFSLSRNKKMYSEPFSRSIQENEML